MSKKTLPLLISALSLALIGTIWIQYLWIVNSLKEKESQIDNKFVMAVSNIEEQLNDYRAMTFISMDSLWTQDITTFKTGYHEMSDYSKEVDSVFQTTMMIEIHQDQADSEEEQHLTIESTDTDEITILREIKSFQLLDSQINNELAKIEELSSFIEKMEFESRSFTVDLRLDSSKIDELIQSEFSAQDLGLPESWGIYDSRDSIYFIKPATAITQLHEIPLFRTDLNEPGRYHLQVQLKDLSLLWNQIRPMVLLSILFILILIFGFVVSIRLILKQKKISQIKSDFINNMTHEFKTPLASISLAADSILHPNTVLSRESVQRYVEVIQSEKQKLNNHVERILEVASLNNKGIEMPLATVSSVNILKKAIDRLQLLIEKTNTIIDFNPSPDSHFKANAFHLENALVNILENAIKYSPEGSTIRIQILENENKTRLTIQDEGIGMSAKQLTKIFDHFYRAQSGNVHEVKGFGLGLTYCKFVIDQMEGSIEVESALKKGTSVHINFKRA